MTTFLQPFPVVATGDVFQPASIQHLWGRAEALLGYQELAALVASHRDGDPNPRHRLVDQLIRLDDSMNGRLSLVGEDAAAVSVPEVDAVVRFAEEWHSSPAWPDVLRGLRNAAEYLHSVSVLAVASLLRARHPATELVMPAAAARQPDLMLVVTDGLPLAVEVKAPPALWQSTTSLDLAAGLHVVRNCLASAGTVRGQLRADRPGVLALAGLLMSQDTYNTLVRSFELHLRNEGQNTTHLLGLAVFNLRERVLPEAGRVSTLLEQQSVLRRNPAYAGPLKIDSDWAGPWQLVRRPSR